MATMGENLVRPVVLAQAIYLGPTFYMTLGKGVSLSGAFEPQAGGNAYWAGNFGRLDSLIFLQL
jgi:hypothetical protein